MLAVASLAGAGLSLGVALSAQSGDRYTARLAWVPTGGGSGRVAGRGVATATLMGRTLAIAGTFEGLGSPASLARLHQGIAKGARGAAIADLTVTKAISGTVSGSVTLTPEQAQGLAQGRLYMQLHSDKGVAPDGANLWGWFLK